MRQIIRNAIRCPDGTVLKSKHRHDYVSHEQKDGRTYSVDGGTAYQKIGYTDKEYENLIVYVDDDISIVREYFMWLRQLDKDGVPLDVPELVYLKDITDEHLDVLIQWTSTGYVDSTHDVMVREKAFRNANK